MLLCFCKLEELVELEFYIRTFFKISSLQQFRADLSKSKSMISNRQNVLFEKNQPLLNIALQNIDLAPCLLQIALNSIGVCNNAHYYMTM